MTNTNSPYLQLWALYLHCPPITSGIAISWMLRTSSEHIAWGSYPKVCTFRCNKDKAISILECEIDSSENICAILKGNKTIAFFRGILTNGQCDEITVDGHAFNIWRGLYTSLNEVPAISNKLYKAVSDDYKAAAVAINEQTKSNWSASQIQAITWVCWRRQNGVTK